jgi:hypothetical protein
LISLTSLLLYSLILLIIPIIFLWSSLLEISCFSIVQVPYCGIVDSCRRYVILLFSYYLCFYIEIYTSEAKLFGSFNPLYSFSWNSLDVHRIVAGLRCYSSPLDWGLRLNNQTGIQCLGNWSSELLRLR